MGRRRRGPQFEVQYEIQGQELRQDVESFRRVSSLSRCVSGCPDYASQFLGICRVSYWITEFFTDCKNKGANENKTWKHISHTVREICNILHDVRKAGRGQYTTAGERAACAFWGQLQAQREMEVLAKRSLVSDPRLSHILNLHLRDNGVMRSELVALNDTIKILQRDITELKKTNSRRQGVATGVGRSSASRPDQE
jgi:hypothetical protein